VTHLDYALCSCTDGNVWQYNVVIKYNLCFGKQFDVMSAGTHCKCIHPYVKRIPPPRPPFLFYLLLPLSPADISPLSHEPLCIFSSDIT
jgi:hypothetical protein